MERWLAANFKPALPTTVLVGTVEKDYQGTFGRYGRTFRIRLNRRLLGDMDAAIHTLLHEWAHALSWSPAWEGEETAHEHPDEWGLWIARLYRAFVDEGGDMDASEFSPRPFR